MLLFSRLVQSHFYTIICSRIGKDISFFFFYSKSVQQNEQCCEKLIKLNFLIKKKFWKWLFSFLLLWQPFIAIFFTPVTTPKFIFLLSPKLIRISHFRLKLNAKSEIKENKSIFLIRYGKLLYNYISNIILYFM